MRWAARRPVREGFQHGPRSSFPVKATQTSTPATIWSSWTLFPICNLGRWPSPTWAPRGGHRSTARIERTLPVFSESIVGRTLRKRPPSFNGVRPGDTPGEAQCGQGGSDALVGFCISCYRRRGCDIRFWEYRSGCNHHRDSPLRHLPGHLHCFAALWMDQTASLEGTRRR
jgi:hypothetical protein